MEHAFLEWLKQQIPVSSAVPLGLTDDAAVLELPPEGELVVTTDMLTEGVDFAAGDYDPVRVGRKALAVNLSDLAAMAARPVAAFISLAVPRTHGLELARRLYSGLLPLAREFEMAIAGGDTNSWDGPLVISVTALGAVTGRGPLLRSTARPGDVILVTGSLGGSILGHHFDFTPRVREASLLHQLYELRAGMDVSDGLSLDLSRMARASGCGAELDLAAIPISPAAHQLVAQTPSSDPNRATPLDHALGDGEDFELILAASASEAERLLQAQPVAAGLHRIGQFIVEPGLWSRTADGQRLPLSPRGYEH